MASQLRSIPASIITPNKQASDLWEGKTWLMNKLRQPVQI
jgi:hypothetical protein